MTRHPWSVNSSRWSSLRPDLNVAEAPLRRRRCHPPEGKPEPASIEAANRKYFVTASCGVFPETRSCRGSFSNWPPVQPGRDSGAPAPPEPSVGVANVCKPEAALDDREEPEPAQPATNDPIRSSTAAATHRIARKCGRDNPGAITAGHYRAPNGTLTPRAGDCGNVWNVRVLLSAVIAIVCTGAAYMADRVTALRAERDGYPVGYHPLTINHRRPPAWQWAVGIGVLFVITFGAAGAIGIAG